MYVYIHHTRVEETEEGGDWTDSIGVYRSSIKTSSLV